MKDNNDETGNTDMSSEPAEGDCGMEAVKDSEYISADDGSWKYNFINKRERELDKSLEESVSKFLAELTPEKARRLLSKVSGYDKNGKLIPCPADEQE